MSLPIQYRPETLKEVYGCQAAVKVLESILKRSADEIPHAYLITGPSGCGKTTLARILASELGAYDHHSKSNMNYVELNSSDFRGIDTIRSIADNIHLSPTKGKYRVWLLDECFFKDTDILMQNGIKKIKDIKKGDVIKNIHGNKKVKNVFVNKIPLNRLSKLVFNNGVELFCSMDHEYYTTKGLVKAKDIDKDSEILYSSCYDVYSTNYKGEYNERKTMSSLQYTIQTENKTTRNLFQILCTKIKEQKKRIRTSANKTMRLLRFLIHNKRNAIKTILFQIMSCKRQIDTSRNTCRPIQRQGTQENIRKNERFLSKWIEKSSIIKKAIFGTNENKQPHASFLQCAKSKRNKKIEWDFAHMERKTWWEWALHSCSTTPSFCFGVGLGGSHIIRKKRERVSHKLQSRLREFETKNSNRSRWEWSSREKTEVIRQKERGEITSIRMESFEIYEPGNNDKSFQSVITDKERNQGYIELYDLEIEDHPSYYANGVLVHNCHQLTKQAQEAMLKYLEDAPSHVIFILCTTNPEKLTITLKRRCTLLEVKPCSTDEIIMLLNEICESEGVKVPSNLIELIEEKALGSPGIALQMLDKIIDLSPKDMKQAITDYQSEEEQVFKLCQLLIKKAPWKEITALLKQLENRDPEELRRMILGYCKSVLLRGQNNRAACIIECFWEPLYDIGFPGLVFCCYQSIQ